MSRTLSSPLHIALYSFVIEQRKAKGLTQSEVARRLRRHQSYVANVENGHRRIDVIELIEMASAIGFDPAEAVRKLGNIGDAQLKTE